MSVSTKVEGVKGGKGFRAPVAELLHQCRQSFYVAFGLTFLIDLLSLAPILYMWNTFDRVISSRSGVTLVSLTVLVVGLYIFWSALEWLRSRLMVRLSLRIDWELAADVFDASFRRYVGRRGVNVHQLLGDLLALRQFLTGQPVLALMDAPFAVIFVIIGFIFHPLLALFVVVATVLMLMTSYSTQKISGPILRAANDENAEAARVAAGSLRQAEATLALGMMGAIRTRWYNRHRKFLEYQANASEATGLTGGVSGFLAKSLPSLQMGLGAWLAIQGYITGGMVIAASMLITKSVAPIQKLVAQWQDIVMARQAYDRLNALLTDDVKASDGMQLPPPIGKLEVTNATVLPPGAEKPVVFDVSFQVEPGQALGIVGPSASGKTCLTRLLIGIWRPVRGSVRLDGVELADWSHDEVGPHVGYVPQEIEFFEGSIAENIARLGPVDPEKVIAAARLIGMHDTILTFPQGYDTRIGDTGFAPSGGQRQRLAIARALYGSPRYIVMDEPNANLDEAGENILIEAIRTLKAGGASIIVTTHRPRIVGVADNLLVLRGGRQVGYGPTRDMIRAVRQLQVVKEGETAKPETAEAEPAAPAAATTETDA